MKVKNQWWQNAKSMPVSNEVLLDDCFSVGGAEAVKVKSRQRGNNRRFCRWSWLASASIREAEKSEQLPEDFSTGKVNVRIHYLKMRFIRGFTLILPVQCCAVHEQCKRKFLSYSSVDMKEKRQNKSKASRSGRQAFLHAGFPLDAGAIANRKNTLFQNETKPFENQLKSVLCLVP